MGWSRLLRLALPILPLFLVDHWDADAVDGRDSLTVHLALTADEPVIIDWGCVRITTADGRPLHRVRLRGPDIPSCRHFAKAGRDCTFSAALPHDPAGPPYTIYPFSAQIEHSLFVGRT